MVVESQESIQGTKTCHILHMTLFLALADSKHKNVHRRAHGCLWVMVLEQTESRRVALSSGLWSPKSKRRPVQGKYETMDKTSKNCMHWNVALDALPGSATIGLLA